MRRVLAILAAGGATRAGVDKVLADLGGQPVLAWSLAAGAAAGCFPHDVGAVPAGKRPTGAGNVAHGTPDLAGSSEPTVSCWSRPAAFLS